LSKLGGKRNAIGSHFLVDLLEVFELEEYNEDSFLQRPLQSLRRRTMQSVMVNVASV
jgi:hypothetical protein